MKSEYLQIGPVIRINPELEVEVWRKFLWGDQKLACTCDRSEVQINTYYKKFMRTLCCGNFGKNEIGLDAIKTSELLRIARLDTKVSENIHADGTKVGSCNFGGREIGMSLDGSRMVYPYSSLNFVEEIGELRSFGHGRLIAEFSEEESKRVNAELRLPRTNGGRSN